MKTHSIMLATLVAASSFVVAPAQAQDARAEQLGQQLMALDASPELGGFAAYERLQARQALEVLTKARSSKYDAALYVAERRVRIAEIAARTEAMQRQVHELDRQRSDLIVEASRRDAAQARAEAERLRVQAQIQAEEAARLRQQTMTDAEMMADVESALKGVADTQAAKLRAARAREAELARQEAELLGQPPADGKSGKK